MKAYVISLDTPTELLNRLMAENLDVELFKGINGKKMRQDQFSKYVTKTWKTFGPKSAIGCALSHLFVWKQFLATNQERAIVFEDDVVLTQNFQSELHKALAELPSDLDVLYLGYFHGPIFSLVYRLLGMQNKHATKSNISSRIIVPHDASATHAYMITRKGAKTLVQTLEGHIFEHVDFCMQYLSSKNLIKSYALASRIAYQTSTDGGSKSLNVSNKHPFLLRKILDRVYLDKMVSASYLTSISLVRVGSVIITGSSVIIGIIGILLWSFHMDIKFVVMWYILFSCPDLLYGNLQDVVFHLIVLLCPWIVSISMSNNTSKKLQVYTQNHRLV
jgi:glycosyl transferase family 25